MVVIGVSFRAATMARATRARMPLLAEDIDDVGEIGFRRARDDVGRGRAGLAHPHVERTVETEREAALGLVELHRGDADIHHDAVDGIDALRRTDLGEIGKAVLDQRQPARGAFDQLEAAGNRRAVAIDRDDAGSRHIQDRAAVAAGAEGGVDIDAAIARARDLDRLAAEHGDMTRRAELMRHPRRVQCRTGVWTRTSPSRLE